MVTNYFPMSNALTSFTFTVPYAIGVGRYTYQLIYQCYCDIEQLLEKTNQLFENLLYMITKYYLFLKATHVLELFLGGRNKHR